MLRRHGRCYSDDVAPHLLLDEMFRRMYRMTMAAFDRLLSGHGVFAEPRRADTTPVRVAACACLARLPPSRSLSRSQLMHCLYRLARGSTIVAVADKFGVGTTSVVHACVQRRHCRSLRRSRTRHAHATEFRGGRARGALIRARGIHGASRHGACGRGLFTYECRCAACGAVLRLVIRVRELRRVVPPSGSDASGLVVVSTRIA